MSHEYPKNRQDRWSRVVAAIRTVSTPSDEEKLLDELLSAQKPLVLGFVNAHAMNCIVRDERFFDALMSADILLRDGSGMVMLYRRMGIAPGFNMNGTDFIPKVLVASRGRKVALWGTQSPYLELAADRCRNELGVHVISREHGFHDDGFYQQLASAINPQIIVLGMGMPKQERVAASIRNAGFSGLIICGGAIIDFLGGKVTRAPSWMRKLGCEWLYRLLCEPLRLFKRYLIGNPLFLFRAWRWSGG